MDWMCRVHDRMQPIVASRKRLGDCNLVLTLDPRERHRAEVAAGAHSSDKTKIAYISSNSMYGDKVTFISE